MKSNGFDKLAFIYDHLAKLVFGRSIVESQKYFLNRIPEGSRILILGGGTGWILTELFKLKKEVNVCYIDASSKMIEIAKKRSNDPVQFIQGTENDIPIDGQFNIVITNFYLDLFTDEALAIAMSKIRKSQVPNAKWIATDFIHDKWWHQLMLAVMYSFFRIASNIQSRNLPDWRKELQAIGATRVDSKRFYKGFIETSIFQF